MQVGGQRVLGTVGEAQCGAGHTRQTHGEGELACLGITEVNDLFCVIILNPPGGRLYALATGYRFCSGGVQVWPWVATQEVGDGS